MSGSVNSLTPNRVLRDTRRALWLAVIERTILDALGQCPDVGKGSRPRVIAEAKAWLSVRNADFREICHLAGVNPEHLTRKLPEIFERYEGKRQTSPVPMPPKIEEDSIVVDLDALEKVGTIGDLAVEIGSELWGDAA